jgi:phosphoribosylformylglycinamidine cyclo-ligase
MSANAYRLSGVDIDAGTDLINKIKPLAKSTSRSGVMGGLGGFGAFFDLKATNYQDPVLVAATDGVGTKLKVAIETKRHTTIGIDLVAMCVNDLIVQGAEPLFFLDYFASGKLDVAAGTDIISGIAEGCRQAGCALIGGETAEMPGMYHGGDYDLAGFAVGAVERHKMITGQTIAEGDVVFGFPSSGLHSNGYSLVRKILEQQNVTFNDKAPFDNQKTMADILLEPTLIYVSSFKQILQQTSLIKGLAHITGGGLLENIPRILPEDLGVTLESSSWTVPPVMQWLRTVGNLTDMDMVTTFNAGLGMIAICASHDSNELERLLSAQKTEFKRIGTVTKRMDMKYPVLVSGWMY